MKDCTEIWRERVRRAAASGQALRFRGGGSKDFYGRTPVGEPLDTREHAGVVAYEPTELVVTVRAGTPLAELEALLAGQGQMLPFEPPGFGAATVGGCVAAGLSGPRRQAAGGVRDYVLGVKLIDGRGEVLSFGGQVMKNVAGYDVPRLMVGSLGTLGLLLEVSLKVLPRPVAEASLRFALDERSALERLNTWGGQPLPLSASAWQDGVLTLRLSGAAAAVQAAVARLGGEQLEPTEASAFWLALREQTTPLLAGDATPLWRFALPTTAAPLGLPGAQLIEWGGGLRWLRADVAMADARARATALGGHATLYRGGARDGSIFQPLEAPVLAIHTRLKKAFDPAGIFNPGRLYQEI